jgi:hypothetical protein
MSCIFRFTALILLLAVSTNGCLGFSGSVVTMSASSFNKGSAAKPYEKKKIAVFGTGGYLGACAYGFLQRAGSLYGTGIAGVGAPRAIVATAAGSANLNSILSQNFVLAQADESFIRPTDMTSIDNIQSKLNGFDAAIIGTRYCYKTLPVTMGTFGKSPNDKTREFYLDQPRSLTSKLLDDPEYSSEIFSNTLEACKNSNTLRHLVVVETDAEFDDEYVGDKYLQLLEESEIPYTYIRPLGKMENIENFTFKKGIQSELKISRANTVEELLSVEDKKIYREHIAAVCVQSLMTLGWEDNRVIQVEQSSDDLDVIPSRKDKSQKEWCMNSGIVMNSLAGIP